MALQPLKPDTFTADLKKLTSPDEDTVRHPLEFIVPIHDVDNPEDKRDECADKSFYNMMGYVKMLQKHHSDMIMTTKIKPFTDEESKLWQEHRDGIMLRIVEAYSIIEFIRLYPNLTKHNAEGKLEFDLTAFTPFAKKTKDGSVYIDEYALNKAKAEHDEETAKAKKRLTESHVDYDAEKGRILTEEEVREKSKLPEVVVEEVVEEEENETLFLQ